MSGSNLLFVLTGSIACYKACEAISRLVQRGHRVRPLATKAALKFVGPATLEGLTGERVVSELFAEGSALDHIGLVRWADATVVCPATANTLNRLAAGLGDDLAGALLLAHDWQKPLLLAPAMNPAMWSHPATRAAVERLAGWGAQFIAVGQGRMACGEIGEGRLAEPAEIVAAVETALAPPGPRLRLLITSGGTTEPIDGVRCITNTSTGATGAMLAEYFARRGHQVVALRAPSARRPAARCREELFGTYADLDAALARLLATEEFDVVIHAAAVSDFAVEAIEVAGVRQPPAAGKLSSAAAPTLRLRRNPKLLDSLRARSRNPAIKVVAFKLTLRAEAAEVATAVRALLRDGVADLVVHNDLAARGKVGGAFPAEIWRADGTVVERCTSRAEIGPALERLLAATTPAGAST